MEAKEEEDSTLFDSLRFTKELEDRCGLSSNKEHQLVLNNFILFFTCRDVTESDVELVSYSFLFSAYLTLNGSKSGEQILLSVSKRVGLHAETFHQPVYGTGIM